jgi:hypothetical protein
LLREVIRSVVLHPFQPLKTPQNLDASTPEKSRVYHLGLWPNRSEEVE